MESKICSHREWSSMHVALGLIDNEVGRRICERISAPAVVLSTCIRADLTKTFRLVLRDVSWFVEIG
jgi:hypothetical protein